MKNRKSPGQDDIVNELLKYGGERLIEELSILTQRILEQQKQQEQKEQAQRFSSLKKGIKQPENYKGSNLLCITFKLVIKVIANLISERITLAEEQQWFRSRRACTDAAFVVRQITEKSI